MADGRIRHKKLTPTGRGYEALLRRDGGKTRAGAHRPKKARNAKGR